jgi:hypothetical protein
MLINIGQVSTSRFGGFSDDGGLSSIKQSSVTTVVSGHQLCWSVR